MENSTFIPTENAAVCQNCGMKVKAEAPFCPYCGQPVEVEPKKTFCELCGSRLNVDGICTTCGVKSEEAEPSLANIAAYNQSIEDVKNKKSKKKAVLRGILISLGALFAFSLFSYVYVLPEAYYQIAGWYFKQQEYEDAYTFYNKLDDYKNSESKKDDSISRWAKQILDNNFSKAAIRFKNEVVLPSTRYAEIYEQINAKIAANPEYSKWGSDSSAIARTKTVCFMLQSLPSSYRETAKLTKLFELLVNHGLRGLHNDKDFLKTIWDIAFIRNYLTSDSCITSFLEHGMQSLRQDRTHF